MNKKSTFIYIFILVSLVLIMASGCGHTEPIHEDSFFKANTEDDVLPLKSVEIVSDHIKIVTENIEAVVESGSNFRVTRIDDDINDAPKFRYEVFNNQGKTVWEGTGWRAPSFRNISDDVLEISIGAGTGTQMVQFYSSKNDLISEVFNNPILVTYELIGLLRWDDASTLTLFVRNIFDKDTYYKEFTLESFAAVANPMDAIVKVEYLDNSTLEITYLSGENFDKKVVTLEL